jgi:hypothetical protein
VRRSRPTRAAAVAAIVALAGLIPARADADDLPDYDPHSSQWNGLSLFVGLAGGMGYACKETNALQWEELGDEDILILLYPLRRVDPEKLDAFIRAGGHAVVADDFGEAGDAISGLELIRAEVGAPDASRYHDGRAFAPIARPLAPDHPIATQIKEVVTNYPAILTRVEGATPVIGFSAGQAVVVAGERGTGRFVVVSDPSIFINLMQEFEGNAQLAANILRWLDRGARARNIVILRGDVGIHGQPRSYIDDANAGPVKRAVLDLNHWLDQRKQWRLTPVAMRIIAALLALTLVTLVVLAMPVRRHATADGSWLRLLRPGRRDAPDALIAAADRADDGLAPGLVVTACVLRDLAQGAIGRAIDRADPIYSMTEAELVAAVSRARSATAGSQVARVYKRLRALPSRSQAAAPWGKGELARREFDRLYQDVAELCRTLGEEL